MSEPSPACLRRVCVFCGSSRGTRSEYHDAATALAQAMAARGIELVFGGGGVGLMGTIADAILAAGGHAIGVIPEALRAREVAHRGLPDLRVVDSMHARKALMAQLSDAFVALPGGFGTFEEFCEVVTWTQLGLHRKRCGLLNVGGILRPPAEALRPGGRAGVHRERQSRDRRRRERPGGAAQPARRADEGGRSLIGSG